MNTNLSVSNLAKKLVEKLIDNSKKLNVLVKKGPLNCTIVDAGIEIKGSEQAGKLIAEICMGGLGIINLKKTDTFPNWPLETKVKSKHPVISCLASQYAGWNLSHEREGHPAFLTSLEFSVSSPSTYNLFSNSLLVHTLLSNPWHVPQKLSCCSRHFAKKILKTTIIITNIIENKAIEIQNLENATPY